MSPSHDLQHCQDLDLTQIDLEWIRCHCHARGAQHVQMK